MHSLGAASVVLLALCRALASLIPMAVFAREANAILTSGVLAHPAALAVWTLLLSVLARREADAPRGGHHACLSCGQPMLAGATRCSECGKSPNAAINEMRRIQRRLVRAFGVLSLFGAMATAFAVLLPQRPRDFSDGRHTQDATLIFAILAVLLMTLFLDLEAKRIDSGRSSMPRLIGLLIAMLAMIDLIALAVAWQPLAIACLACLGATLLLQRRIAGS